MFPIKLPKSAGTYVLVLYLPRCVSLRVGRTGVFAFHKGYYAYIGSAFGPGGLHARLRRHLVKEKRCRWHIDYLRAVAEPKEIWFTTRRSKREHVWANAFETLRKNCVGVSGFGCSDCTCRTHLFFFQSRPQSNLLRETRSLQKVKIIDDTPIDQPKSLSTMDHRQSCSP